MTESALRELAALYGIVDEEIRPGPGGDDEPAEFLVDLLRAAGVVVASAAEAKERLREELRAVADGIVPPVMVVLENDLPLRVVVALPIGDTSQYQWTLTEESGNRSFGQFSPKEPAGHARAAEIDAHCQSFLLETEQKPPCGYHRLAISAAGAPDGESVAAMMVIVAPACCYIPPGVSGTGRVWGFSVDLHAVRSRSNWGIGEFSDLLQMVSWGAIQGVGVVHTPPLSYLDPNQWNQANPYSPSSRAHLNPLFVTIEAIPEFAGCDEVQNLVNDARYQARLAAIRGQEQIDYAAIYQLKEEAFRLLWQHFAANNLNPATGRGNDFRRFQEEGGQLLHWFALYVAILEKVRGDGQGAAGWEGWPESLRHPDSEAVREFGRHHQYEIEYQQYKQWLAAEQLAGIGRRSMELGLKVGLFADFPYSHAGNGFESWLFQDVLLAGACIVRQRQGLPYADPAAGLPLTIPTRFIASCFQQLIAGLRHTMKQAGAVCIRSIEKYCTASFHLTGKREHRGAGARYPFGDLLGIIALESQRNRCLVVVDHADQLSPEQRDELDQRNFFTWNTLFKIHDSEKRPLTAHYPENSVVSSSALFLAGLKGLWKGVDIAAMTDGQLYRHGGEREGALLARASDRARFLINLEHEGLLPDGYGLDQAGIPDIDHALMVAAQVLLARSAAKILLVTINDLLGNTLQASVPAMSDQTYWISRWGMLLERFVEDRETAALLLALRRERGLGVSRPSAPAPDRRKRQGLRVPNAFYRLQLHKGFTFLQAAEIVPYLQQLGISHCYVSPFLMARSGSPHGYDIIDHGCLNPEIGSREDFEKLIAVLDEHGMALLLDIVPNHMGVGSDNRWWMDVLENGEASMYAGFFDINWRPLQWDMAGRVLLPVLGDHYGRILEDGKLVLNFHEGTGALFISYYDKTFPLDPSTFPEILAHDLDRLSGKLGEQHNAFLEYQSIVSAFANLPGRENCSDSKRTIRIREKESNKRLLARLCGNCPEVLRFIEENVILFNGESGKPSSYDLLHELLEKQAYRLAFWRVAADEINYRRFFDINDLAGLRMEDKEVFERTHSLVIDLITTGKIDGLRVDHPDGLYDPGRYFARLEAAAAWDDFESTAIETSTDGSRRDFSLYVVVEKILADCEHLPEAWSVCGTTGYEFSHSANGLFIDAAAEKSMTLLYQQFIGERLDFDEIVYNSKKHIITSAMVGELNVLTSLLFRLAREERASRDFTLNILRQGLTEIVASFPVYRTYITPGKIARRDVDFIQWAVSRAKARTQLNDASVLDFIQQVLLLRKISSRELLPRYLDFVMRVQQYTGPVMAKGMEDTTFYIYNRLLSLNEVGGNPRRFGTSMAAFHRINAARLTHWPNSMVNSSTHDSKRSEDVRARINVLTELVPQWRKRLFRWSKFNRRFKKRLQGSWAPSKNDEYALYQNLLGAWDGRGDEEKYQVLIERMSAAAIKACREAKCHTSWISPNVDYEEGVRHFVEGILSSANSAFLDDFSTFQKSIAWFGMLNSLSQVLLKLAVPGIPDIYQGNEVWRYCLVDPDNRRPVDFARRQVMLSSMVERMGKNDREIDRFQLDLLENFSDGGAKMYTMYRTLALRKLWPDVFARGKYVPLEVAGEKSRHLCAFMRKLGGRMVVAVAPRLYSLLLKERTGFPFGVEVWGDTTIVLPEQYRDVVWTNMFSNKPARTEVTEADVCSFLAGRLFQSWPVALLKGTFSNAKAAKITEVGS